METKAIVFDMDGVLFDTERLYMEAWSKVAEKKNLGDMTEATLGCVGLSGRDTKKYFLKNFGEDFPFDSFMEDSAKEAKEMIARDGLPIKSGVKELLEYLKAERYQIGLASSTREARIVEHLEEAGIREYFQVVVGGDMVDKGKPAPDIYLLACEKLGVNPTETYAIEDSTNGIRSANAAGMKTIIVPDLIVPDMEIEKDSFARCKDLIEVIFVLMGRNISRIPLQGIGNTRDLGGFVTKDGRCICSHRLLRSGTLMSTTKQDRKLLTEEYCLKTIVDFRTLAEQAGQPDPEIEGITSICNPILEEAALGITRENEDEKAGVEKRDIIAEVAKNIGSQGNVAEQYMKNMYLDIIRSDYSRAQYKKFFSVLLEQKEGAVLWHCSAGKDRVGVGTALVLSALGVPRDMIIADYMKTNEFGKQEIYALMKKIEEKLDTSTPKGKEMLAGIRLLFTVEATFLLSVFEQIDNKYGNIEAFLEQEMGLNSVNRQKLQNMFLE